MLDLIDLIENRGAKIGVVGLGYAGLPVAEAFAEAGFEVAGVDLDAAKVSSLLKGESYIVDVSSRSIANLIGAGKFTASSDYGALADRDVILVCVPTPLRDHQPDLSAVEGAGESISGVMKSGTLVVLESTSFPGTTEEVLQPLLEKGGKRVGDDFYLAFSPERIDPGNISHSFRDIPKVVGGVTPRCTELATALYSTVADETIKVPSPKEAELSKLLENTFRNVNIALVNELAIYAHDLGIDIWSAIDAAASKPFGFMPFYPGPGVGGHCIGIDPSYLSWKVRQSQGHAFRFIELADELNRTMPRFVVNRIAEILNEQQRSIRGSKILLVGVAYKPGVSDYRESPALRLWELLENKGANVSYHDPLVAAVEVVGKTARSSPLDAKNLEAQDIVVVVTPHQEVDVETLQAHARVIFDTRNALKGADPEKVIKL